MNRAPAAEKDAFEILEEAFHLLRLAPGIALVAYYVGSLPFILGLLYFWSDMARSAFAEQRLVTGSLLLTALFVWMKTWQSVSARHLLAHLCGEAQPRWRPAWLLLTGVRQAIVQPAGLFLLSVAAVIVVPFGWTIAFFNAATVLSGDTQPGLRMLLKRSVRQAMIWPLQNHGVLVAFVLFGLFVFFNLYIGVLAVPFLMDTLLGISTVFTVAPWAAFNSTVVAAIVAMAWLCLDPILKSAAVLRCFYGESLQTGQDLKAEIRSFASGKQLKRVAATALLLAFIAACPFLKAADSGTNAPHASRGAASVAPASLDRTIDRVIQQREYSWRLPRETPADADNNSRPSVLQTIRDKLSGWFKSIEGVLRDFWRWLTRLGPRTGGAGAGIASAIGGLFLALIVLLVVLLGWFLYRAWLGGSKEAPVTPEILPPAPNLEDENVGAEQLPEDGWMQLARELLERGELRLALRALYLATLASLASRNLITLARFKSNRDYARELRRRSHALADIPDLFAENVGVFERVWYGLHEVSHETLEGFTRNVERIKGAA